MNKPVDPKTFGNTDEVRFVMTSPESLDAVNKEQSIAFGGNCMESENYPIGPEDDFIEVEYAQQFSDALVQKAQSFEALEEALFREQIDIDIDQSNAQRLSADIKDRFDQYLESQKDVFNRKQRRYLSAHSDLAKVKERLGLNRAPKVNKLADRIGHGIAFTLLEASVTTVMNVSGGIAMLPALSTAIGITILNVFLFGYVTCAEAIPRARKANSKKSWPLWGFLGVGLTTFMFSLNSLLAHYRSEGGNFEAAKAAFFDNPVGFSSIHGYFLFGMGVLVSIMAGVLFYTARDPIFAYGEAGERKADTLAELEAVAPNARAGKEKLEGAIDQTIVALLKDGKRSFKTSQTLTYKAKKLWGKCAREIEKIRKLFERATGLHRTRMQKMWNKHLPAYYKTDPDLTHLAEGYGLDNIDAEFERRLAEHKADLEAFHVASEETRKVFEEERMKASEFIQDHLVFKSDEATAKKGVPKDD